uniref:Uncharacterized protein n=1 Tax=Mycena chlorophos TaxID=658473 RepID=A0ABQ0LDK8_MYCCL|nr:predicted protein [Mycena chlorophos]
MMRTPSPANNTRPHQRPQTTPSHAFGSEDQAYATHPRSLPTDTPTTTTMTMRDVWAVCTEMCPSSRCRLACVDVSSPRDAALDVGLAEALGGAEDGHGGEEDEPVASVPAESSSPRYLRAVRDRVQEEIDLHGEPSCYRRGDLYERAPHMVFALKTVFTRTTVDGHPEDILYARDVCIWEFGPAQESGHA